MKTLNNKTGFNFFKKLEGTGMDKKGITGVIAALLIVLFFVLQLIVIFLSFKVVNFKVDLTKYRNYSVSNQAKTFLKKYDKDVKIILFKKGVPEFENDGCADGCCECSRDAYTFKFAKKIVDGMTRLNKHIKSETINISENPDVSAKYSKFDIKRGGIVVQDLKNAENVKFIPRSEWMINGQQWIEGKVLKALEFVEENKLVKTAVVVEDVDSRISWSIKNLSRILNENGFDVSVINLNDAKEIPDSLDSIITISSRVGLSSDGVKKIKNFSDKGKIVNVFYNCNDTVEEKFSSFLEEFGIKIRKEGRVQPTKLNNMVEASQFMKCVVNKKNEDLKKDDELKKDVAVGDVKPCDVSEKEGVSLTQVVSSTNDCVCKNFNNDKNDNDKKSYPIVVTAQKRLEENKVATVNAFMSKSFYDSRVGGTDFDNLEVMIDVLNSNIRKRSTVKVVPRRIKTRKFRTRSQYEMLVLSILLMVVIPLIFIALAVGVKIYRTRRC